MDWEDCLQFEGAAAEPPTSRLAPAHRRSASDSFAAYGVFVAGAARQAPPAGATHAASDAPQLAGLGIKVEEMPLEDAPARGRAAKGDGKAPQQGRKSSALDPSTLDSKRAKRILANRQSAARSRMKRLQHMHDLDQQLERLDQRHAQLQAQLQAQAQQERRLRGEQRAAAQQLQAQQAELRRQQALQQAWQQQVEYLRSLVLGGQGADGAWGSQQHAQHQRQEQQQQHAQAQHQQHQQHQQPHERHALLGSSAPSAQQHFGSGPPGHQSLLPPPQHPSHPPPAGRPPGAFLGPSCPSPAALAQPRAIHQLPGGGSHPWPELLIAQHARSAPQPRAPASSSSSPSRPGSLAAVGSPTLTMDVHSELSDERDVLGGPLGLRASSPARLLFPSSPDLQLDMELLLEDVQPFLQL